jgi:hypothetical protein
MKQDDEVLLDKSIYTFGPISCDKDGRGTAVASEPPDEREKCSEADNRGEFLNGCDFKSNGVADDEEKCVVIVVIVVGRLLLLMLARTKTRKGRTRSK